MSAAVKGPAHPQWKGENVTAGTAHTWLNYHFPRAERCEECGAEGKTDYAFLRHPAPYTRERSDYRELCRRCHLIFDEHPLIQKRERCRRGHELTEDNVIVSGARRWCKTCKRASGRRAQRRYRERQGKAAA